MAADLINRLAVWGRCCHGDLENAMAALSRGEWSEAEIVRYLSPFGFRPKYSRVACAWITDFTVDPRYNGKACFVKTFEPSTRIYMVKLMFHPSCSDGVPASDFVRVGRENLSESPPNGASHLEQISALFAVALGTDVAARICHYIQCLRCDGPCTPGTLCRIQHPAARRAIVVDERQRPITDTLPDGKVCCYFLCGVCDQYDAFEMMADVTGKKRYTRGDTMICFEGEHLLIGTRSQMGQAAQRDSTERLTIRERGGFPFLQPRLDDFWNRINETLRVLTLTGARRVPAAEMREQKRHMYTLLGLSFRSLKELFLNFGKGPGANVRLCLPQLAPKLERLRIDLSGGMLDGVLSSTVLQNNGSLLKYVSIESVLLYVAESELFTAARSLEKLRLVRITGLISLSQTQESSAFLKGIFLESIGSLQSFTLQTPNLRDLTIMNCANMGSLSGVADSPLLEILTIENLPMVETLQTASNCLSRMSVFGASGLKRLTAWAPNLEVLLLGNCDQLETVSFLERHALQSRLPPKFIKPQLRISLRSSLSDSAMVHLRQLEHPSYFIE